MDKPLYIFDAGGSKTDLVMFSSTSEPQHITLPAFNPNRNIDDFLNVIQSLDFSKNGIIHFYGSGLKSKLQQNKVKSFFPDCEVNVYSDIQGAVRATQKDKGIVSILGTGAVVTYFENDAIITTRGGYGYLIDDWGGGLELGKIVISHWLSDDFKAETNSNIEKVLGINRADFIDWFYQQKDNKKISGICTALNDLTTHDKVLEQVIQKYFNTFIERHVLPLTEQYKIRSFSIIGSIGKYFKDKIAVAALNHGIKIDLVIEKPIKNLLKYHDKM